mmetsp:Transcript_5853/g.18471  ORF Transcript_5853/g.18471 Transcript_5853/m.18471 type:complete len:240 (+) Transcript_5853:181-900(+)
MTGSSDDEWDALACSSEDESSEDEAPAAAPAPLRLKPRQRRKTPDEEQEEEMQALVGDPDKLGLGFIIRGLNHGPPATRSTTLEALSLHLSRHVRGPGGPSASFRASEHRLVTLGQLETDCKLEAPGHRLTYVLRDCESEQEKKEMRQLVMAAYSKIQEAEIDARHAARMQEMARSAAESKRRTAEAVLARGPEFCSQLDRQTCNFVGIPYTGPAHGRGAKPKTPAKKPAAKKRTVKKR